jgi:drug/metabolite transporter (DMT)-like permease
MDKSLQRKGYIQIFITGCLWGTIGLFVTLMSDMGADGSLISLLRIGSACVLMFFFALVKGGGLTGLRIDRKTLSLTMLIGVLGQAVFNLCYARAIQIAGVATGAVLLYTAPAFVFVIATVFFKEAATPKKLLALFINIVGCVLTVTGGNFTALSFPVTGVIMGVLAGFFYALSTVISKLAANRAHPYVLTFYSFLFATIFLLLIKLRQGFDAAVRPGGHGARLCVLHERSREACRDVEGPGHRIGRNRRGHPARRAALLREHGRVESAGHRPGLSVHRRDEHL